MTTKTALLTREGTITETAGRQVTVRLFAWDDPRPVVCRDTDLDFHGTTGEPGPYAEAFKPGGGLTVHDACAVRLAHHQDLIGRAEPATLSHDGKGPTVTLTIAETAAGRDAMALLESRVVRDVSIEFDPRESHNYWESGTLYRDNLVIRGIALAFQPAHDAPVLAVREENSTEKETANMSTATTDEVTGLTREETETMIATATREAIAALEDTLKRELVREDDGRLAEHPLASFESFGDYVKRAYHEPELQPLLTRALADQITSQNPGVLPPGWVKTVYGIIDLGRPVARNFGVTSLPPSGMDVNWPYFAGNLLDIVDKQATEKTGVKSVRVDILKGTKAIETFAGASDISNQLIERSDPSYIDTYQSIMALAFAARTEHTASADALAGATGSVDYDWTTGDATGDGYRAALFAASVAVMKATQLPATFALCAEDVFLALGGKTNIHQNSNPVQNVAGTATASTLSVNVSGVPHFYAPHLAAGNCLVSNNVAASWREDGPKTISAPDVEKLGQNVGMWGMGCLTVHSPAGIVNVKAAA